jgi:hypothetical protein
MPVGTPVPLNLALVMLAGCIQPVGLRSRRHLNLIPRAHEEFVGLSKTLVTFRRHTQPHYAQDCSAVIDTIHWRHA